MKLDDVLKSLQQLPPDEQAKHRIQAQLARPVQKRNRREWFIPLAIACLALFLLLLPQQQLIQDAASDEIQQVYTYFGGKEGQFKAKSSLLYTSIDTKKTATTVAFFEEMEQWTKIESTSLGEHIVDVIVVRESGKQRFQLGDLAMYAVDTNIYYASDSERYEAIFNELYNSKPFEMPLLMPVGVMVMNVVASYLYKRRRLDEKELRGQIPYLNTMAVIAILAIVGMFVYMYFVGPLWKPAMYGVTLVSFYFIWRHTRRYYTHPFVRKVEGSKLLLTVLLLFVFYYQL